MNIMFTLKLSLQTSSSTSKTYCTKETSKEGPLHISTCEIQFMKPRDGFGPHP